MISKLLLYKFMYLFLTLYIECEIYLWNKSHNFLNIILSDKLQYCDSTCIINYS